MENALPKGLRLEGTLKKEAGLENTLPKVVDGTKAHLKRRQG